MSKITDFFNRFNKKFEITPATYMNSQGELQYRYEDIIGYMRQTGELQVFMQEYNKIMKEQDKYYPSKVHGLEHTSRVTLFATMLAALDNLSEYDKELLLVAARYHDVGRRDDRENKEHGAWGVQKSKGLDLLQGYSDEAKQIIEFAIEQHSLSREQNEVALSKIPEIKRERYRLILSYLKDADALDRVRIANRNMQLDPKRLRSKTAKMMVDLAYTNYREFNNLVTSNILNPVEVKQTSKVNKVPFRERFLSRFSEQILCVDCPPPLC